MLDKGDRVATPAGNGVVQYVRMEPPNFTRIAGVSVKLDGKDHAGAVFCPSEVIPIPDNVSVKACDIGTARTWFESNNGGDIVYVCMRRDSKRRLRVYRIAPHRGYWVGHAPEPGWRIDELEIAIWCAVNDVVYPTAQEAAAQFENLEGI